MVELIGILPINNSSTKKKSELKNALIYHLSPLTPVYFVTSIIYSAEDVTLLKGHGSRYVFFKSNWCFYGLRPVHTGTGLEAQSAVTAIKVSVFEVSV